MQRARRGLSPTFKAFLAISTLLLLFLLLLFPQYHYSHFRQQIQAAGRRKLEECRLPRVDPWDPAIVAHLNPKYCELSRSYQECLRKYPRVTSLEEGLVRVNRSLLEVDNICQFRCLYPKTDFDLLMGLWKEPSARPDCDVVEVQCNASASNETAVYSYLHSQIYNPAARPKVLLQSTPLPTPGLGVEWRPGAEGGRSGGRAPDVHLLVLDSISHPMFLRSLPKTAMWLRERMDAVSFPFLNKVGLNSRANAFAMFFGFQVWPIEENPMGPAFPPERSQDDLRWVFMDEEPFIGFSFRNKSYRTMMAEDWARGALNWPNYYGFKKQPAEHYMRPFHLRSEKMDDQNGTLTKNLYELSCKDYHHYVLDYLKQFIDAYEDEPKFSITWFVDAAHSGPNGAFWIDNDFYDFLRQYERKMDNAFLIITADHGLRFRSIRETKQGEMEDNNPALFLVVPRHLRWNKRLMDNLRENARQLISQFDTHSTLLDIAMEGSSWTVDSPFDGPSPELSKKAPFGSSLLHRFEPNRPRHCGNLRIPFEYCLCQFHKSNETLSQPELALGMAQIMVRQMNEDIGLYNATELCAPLALNRNGTLAVEMLEFEPEKQINLFQVTYETVPGNGRFWGYIQLEEKRSPSKGFNLITSRFPRLNEYAEQAKCVDEEKHQIAPYCYCRDLLPSATSASPASSSSSSPSPPTTSTQMPVPTTANDVLAAAPDPQLGLLRMEDGQIWLTGNTDAVADVASKGGGEGKGGEKKHASIDEEKVKKFEELVRQMGG